MPGGRDAPKGEYIHHTPERSCTYIRSYFVLAGLAGMWNINDKKHSTTTDNDRTIKWAIGRGCHAPEIVIPGVPEA